MRDEDGTGVDGDTQGKVTGIPGKEGCSCPIRQHRLPRASARSPARCGCGFCNAEGGHPCQSERETISGGIFGEEWRVRFGMKNRLELEKEERTSSCRGEASHDLEEYGTTGGFYSGGGGSRVGTKAKQLRSR